MSQPPAAFVADAALRFEPSPSRRTDYLRRTAAALFAVALELGVFALVYFERPIAVAPQLVEIPVEIVPEPSPSPKPSPAPQPKPQQEYEKPATDAPRAGQSDHDDEVAAQKPKPAAPPPPPAPPSPSPAAAPPPAPDLPETAEAEAPAPAKAAPTAMPAPTQAQAPAPKPDVLAALPKTFDSVPDVDFGGAALRAPVAGGNSKATYLSILFGLTVPRLHIPASVRGYGRKLTGVIELEVDGRGRLMTRYIAESSGSPEFDEAAMRAVAEASRLFPPPPHGQPAGLRFSYSSE